MQQIVRFWFLIQSVYFVIYLTLLILPFVSVISFDLLFLIFFFCCCCSYPLTSLDSFVFFDMSKSMFLWRIFLSFFSKASLHTNTFWVISYGNNFFLHIIWKIILLSKQISVGSFCSLGLIFSFEALLSFRVCD